MHIGPWCDHWSNALCRRDVSVDPAADAALPGESRYFDTSDVSDKGVLVGYQGENVVYYGKDALGDDLYWGHPMGVVTRSQIIGSLNKHRHGVRLDALGPLREAVEEAASAPAGGGVGPHLEQLQALVEALVQSAASRDELKTMMRSSRKEYNDAYDATIRAETEFGKESPQFRGAMEAYRTVSDRIFDQDQETYDRDRFSANSARGLLGVFAEQLRELGPLQDRTPQGKLLQKLCAALKMMLPTNASLRDHGFRLMPYRSA
jgi:hypothetical protein